MKSISVLTFILFLTVLSATSGAVPPEPFRVVFIDDQDTAKLGGFPLPRSMLAAGIEAIAKQKPRGIILKFFIDLPKEGSGDALLAEALTKAPVVLQARILDGEPKPNPMPDRFFLRTLPLDSEVAVSGHSGWLPLALFAKHAHDIGFADLEMAFGGKATIEERELKIGAFSLPLDGQLQMPVAYPEGDKLDYLAFSDLMGERPDAATFTDKVVILGYDGSKIPKIKTLIGELKAHRVFCYSLFDAYRKMRR